METGFARLPWYGRVGAVAALAAAPCVVYWVAWLRPQLQDIDEARSALAGKEAQLQQARRDRAELARLGTRVDDLTLRLGRLGASLSEPEEVSALLRRLQVFAVRSNLTIRAFTPQPPVEHDLHTAWSYRLSLDGTYQGLTGFFGRIGGLSRVVTIDDVVIRAVDPPGPDRTITVECTATAYVLNDPSGPGAGGSGKGG